MTWASFVIQSFTIEVGMRSSLHCFVADFILVFRCQSSLKGDHEPSADQAAPMLGPDLVQIRPPADSDVISEPAILGYTPTKGETGEPDDVVLAGNGLG